MTVDTVQVPRSNLRPPGVEEIAARRIAYERDSRSWSMDELARRVTDAGCRIHASAIMRIESGEPRRKISLDEASAFAKVFGLDLDQLMEPPERDFRERYERLAANLARWSEAQAGLMHQLTTYLKQGAELLGVKNATELLGPDAGDLVAELRRQLDAVRVQLEALKAAGDGLDR